MSKKQKPDPNKEQAASIAAVRPPSAGEQALTSEATGLMDWIKKGDYTQRPKNLFFNYADPAARQRQREMQMNAGPQGVSAFGAGANPNLLALNKQNLQDEWARDTAGQYESDVSQAGIRASGMLGDVAGLENARELGTLGATTSSYNQNMQRVPWWQQLLNSSAQGAAAAATAGSDERAKDNIVPITDALERMQSIRGVSFEWNDNALHLGQDPGKADMGVIAQEVEQAFPELVVTGDDGFKRVNYNGLVGVLFAAVNDLSAKVRELSK